jgi:hypothetical protein
MDIVFEPAWGGGVNFVWEGQEMWAPSVARAQAFVARMVRR